MNKVLIITYYWPPSGGAGVQRWLKFSKYLPQFGWEPFILTVDPKYAAYPVIDSSLEKDIPVSLKIFRTKATDWFRLYGEDKSKIPSAGFAGNKDDSLRGIIPRFIRGNFFIPDPRRGWNRSAIRKACGLIEKENMKHIITTSPPHSSQLIGLRLKKRYPELKWVADLRDPWTDIYYYDLFYPTFISRRLDKYYERSVLKNADIITTVGPTLGKYFESKLTGSGTKIKIIHNGYDESDFENITAEIPVRFTISFTGTLSESYPLEGFIKALKTVIEKGNDIVLKITGLITEVQKGRLISVIGSNNLEFIPYSDHKTAIRQMLSSSIQLLVIAKHPENKSYLSGKIFEYIASGKPVLCLGPVDGDASHILEGNGYGRCFEYEDEAGIADFILEKINQHPTKSKMPPSGFSRKSLAGTIATLL